jgi:hypothetical protein
MAKKSGKALAASSQYWLVDRSKIESVCCAARRAIVRATRPETVEKQAAELEAILAAIKKLKPEFTPRINAEYLFARKRLGELNPKEHVPGPGRGKKESGNNDSFSKAEKNRRWENAALAEFWDHEELNPRLESGTIAITRVMSFVKLERARRKAKKNSGATPIDEVIHSPFQDVMRGIQDESVELIFADPPWDADSISMYEDIGKNACRVLVPGGSVLVYSSSQMLNRTIGMLASEGMRFQGLCYDVRCSGKYARLSRDGIVVRVMPLVWYVKGACRFGSADFVEDAVLTDTIQKDTHDWQQHEDIAEYYIKKLTSKGGIVFDPFCGGGTTSVIAKRLGRRFITCDIDEHTTQAATERIHDAECQ